MKIKIFLLSALIISGCSKNNSEAPLPGPVLSEESSQPLITERLKNAKIDYTKGLEDFTNSKEKKLAERESLFIAFLDKANLYKNLLSTTQDTTNIKKVELELIRQKYQHELILTDIKKLNDSKEALDEALQNLETISSKTDEFILTKITDLDLRDSLLEEISTYKNTTRFLTLSFKKEFDLNEIIKFENKVNELELIEQKFSDYFRYKEVLDQSEHALEKVDFSFLSDDHTTAALTHEEDFFKALNQHIESLDTFKKDASIYLNRKDIGFIKSSKSRVTQTLSLLNELRETQKNIKSDLKRIEYLGYIFPKDLSNIPKEKLKWKEQEVYIFTGVLPEKINWKIGFHRVDLLFNSNYPVETIKEFSLFEFVNKKTYSTFENVFGTAFSRLIVYRTTYDELLPKHIDEKYFKMGLLIGLTYQEVDDYIESIPF